MTGGSSASGSLVFFWLAQRRKWKSEHEVSSPFSLPLPFPLFSDHPCLSPLPLFFLLVSASSRLALDAPETERTFVIVGLQAHIKLKGGGYSERREASERGRKEKRWFAGMETLGRAAKWPQCRVSLMFPSLASSTSFHVPLRSLEIPASLPGAAQGREVDCEVDWVTTTWPKPRQPSRSHQVSGRGVVCRVPAAGLLSLDLPMSALSFGLAVTASPPVTASPTEQDKWRMEAACRLANDLSTRTGEQGLCPPRTLFCGAAQCSLLFHVSCLNPNFDLCQVLAQRTPPAGHGRRSGAHLGSGAVGTIYTQKYLDAPAHSGAARADRARR